MSTETIKALEKAVDLAGSQAELARRISTSEKTVKQQHIWNWLNRDKKVPPENVLDIERATGVSRHDLRPDIYPAEAAA